VGWWAVASDETRVKNKNEQTVILPRGCMVRYREWYGAKKPNEGLKLHAPEVAKGISEREKGERIDYGVIDPAAFSEDGGISIEQAMRDRKPADGEKIVLFRRADNARVPGRGAMGGWDQMRGRFMGDEDGNPMIVCFSTCHDSIRTIPALQHDKSRPEDLDSDMEDHAADEWRYGCMSRPWVRKPKSTDTRNPRDDYRGQKEERTSWRI
jgi:hypothetical protein